jgi:hypothetical protein
MKNLLKFLALGTMLAASTVAAHAGTLSGNLSVTGTYGAITSTLPLTSGTTAISFAASSEATNGGTGSFASPNTTLYSPVTFASTFTFSTGGTLFSFTLNGNTATFTVAANSEYYNPTTQSWTFVGTISGSGFTSTGASFTLTPNGPPALGDFTGILATAPEPNSLVLLGTGLVSAAGMIVRRRRAIVA